MYSGQLQHTNCDYIAAAIKQLEDNRDLTGMLPTKPYNNGEIRAPCSLQVSQRGSDKQDHSCVLFLQTLVPGLAEKNGLVPGEVYVTLSTIFHVRSLSMKKMADHLRDALKDHHDECLKALGRGEHVHESFLGPLVEELQLLMQKYTAPPRKKYTKKKPSRGGRRPSRPKSQVMVPKSRGAAKRLLTNDIAIELSHEMAQRATETKARAVTKNAQLESERKQVESNLKVMKCAKENNVTLRHQVGVMCAVHVIYIYIYFCSGI
jgi:hypothetical protein